MKKNKSLNLIVIYITLLLAASTQGVTTAGNCIGNKTGTCQPGSVYEVYNCDITFCLDEITTSIGTISLNPPWCVTLPVPTVTSLTFGGTGSIPDCDFNAATGKSDWGMRFRRCTISGSYVDCNGASVFVTGSVADLSCKPLGYDCP